MKRCTECRRDYYDETLLYCLDDGAALVDGPASDGVPTAILPAARSSSEAATRAYDQGPATQRVNISSKRSSVMVGVIGGLLVVALGVAGYFYYGRGTANQIETIAVLPFVNQTGNPDIEYLSDGITESLINSLSQIPAVSVKARSSVFTYKGKQITPQQVGRDLSVEAVLNGRVLQMGDQVVLSVELVEAATGNQLWGDQYARKMTDILQLQSEIARDVSGKLKAKLTGEEQQRVTRSYTQNTEAYALYLRGRHHWSKRKVEDIRKGIEYFQQAIDKDPTYALAYAAIAESYILFPNYGMAPAQEAYPKARAAAAKAIEIDPELAEAHNAMASVLHGFDWKFAEAEAAYRKALELKPSYATARQWYAEHLLAMGRYPEALTEMRRAQELDPLSLIINGLLGVTMSVAGQNDEALDQLRKTLEMDPNFPRTHLFLSNVYQSLGRYDEAVDEFAKAVVLNGAPPDRIAPLAAKVKDAAKTGGERAYSRAMAEALESDPTSAQPPAPVLAAHWVRAGEVDRAFEILEQAYRRRDDTILLLKGPGLDPVKSDPRYADLLRRVGLPPG